MSRSPSLVTIGADRHRFSCPVFAGSLFFDREIKLNTTGAARPVEDGTQFKIAVRPEPAGWQRETFAEWVGIAVHSLKISTGHNSPWSKPSGRRRSSRVVCPASGRAGAATDRQRSAGAVMLMPITRARFGCSAAVSQGQTLPMAAGIPAAGRGCSVLGGHQETRNGRTIGYTSLDRLFALMPCRGG